MTAGLADGESARLRSGLHLERNREHRAATHMAPRRVTGGSRPDFSAARPLQGRLQRTPRSVTGRIGEARGHRDSQRLASSQRPPRATGELHAQVSPPAGGHAGLYAGDHHDLPAQPQAPGEPAGDPDLHDGGARLVARDRNRYPARLDRFRQIARREPHGPPRCGAVGTGGDGAGRRRIRRHRTALGRRSPASAAACRRRPRLACTRPRSRSPRSASRPRHCCRSAATIG